MSITATTDVFCDICNNWIFGVTGPRSNARGARRHARENGWVRRRLSNGRRIDVCPRCKKEIMPI